MEHHNIFRTTQKQIGNTLYTVKTMPSEKAAETAKQKVASLVKERVAAEMESSENRIFMRKTT